LPYERGAPANEPKYPDHIFGSSHWNDLNNLVWSRHNDRTIDTPFALTPEDIAAAGGNPEIALRNLREAGIDSNTSLGRFIEEIQSDWHQKGREFGYKGDPVPPYNLTEYPEGRYSLIPRDNPNIGWNAESPEEALRQYVESAYVMGGRVPDAPFRDSYHELALKQQLLDTSNDPNLEWLGVADADTVSSMEGHPSVRPGTELYYNQKHPAALKRLLEPLGGTVEYNTINNISPLGSTKDLSYSSQNSEGRGIFHHTSSTTGKTPIASVINPDNSDDVRAVNQAIRSRLARGGQIPGQGMWMTRLSPELKQLIRERGFPAMTALLALQSHRNKIEGEQ
jgi:hypothetical protein